MSAVGQVDHFSAVSGVADRVPLRNAVGVALPCVIAARRLEEPRFVLPLTGVGGLRGRFGAGCGGSGRGRGRGNGGAHPGTGGG